jgi:MYXO-CTERM domain-containing protein
MIPTNRTLLPALAAATFVLSFTSAASAYRLSGQKWPRGSLPVSYRVDYASSRELGQSTTQQVVEASFAAWAAPSCSAWRSTNAGAITNGTANVNDNQNVLLWHYTSWPRELGGSSTIGVTTPVYFNGSGGGTIVDADIQFNGIDYTWTTNPRRFSDVDAQSIATHEIGHLLGLDHSATFDATMYAAYQGGTGSRSLHSDDINGVCALYPSAPGSECSSSRPCPDNGTCQNGYCIAAPPPVGNFGDDCAGTAACGTDLYCVCTDQAQTQCFCTRDCSDSAPCPNSWSCAPLEGGGGACIQGGTTGTGTLGDACQSGADCSNGYCVGTTTSAICSQPCSSSVPCPRNYRCASLQGGGGACVRGSSPADGGVDGGTTTEDAGTVRPPQEIGAACSSIAECRSNYCTYLTETERLCSRPCRNDGECPSGFACTQSATGSLFCFPAQPGGEDAGTSGEPDAGEPTSGETDGGDPGPSNPPAKSGCTQSGDDARTSLLLALLAFVVGVALRRRRS